jgi:hypothetical protein
LPARLLQSAAEAQPAAKARGATPPPTITHDRLSRRDMNMDMGAPLSVVDRFLFH